MFWKNIQEFSKTASKIPTKFGKLLKNKKQEASHYFSFLVESEETLFWRHEVRNMAGFLVGQFHAECEWTSEFVQLSVNTNSVERERANNSIPSPFDGLNAAACLSAS